MRSGLLCCAGCWECLSNGIHAAHYEICREFGEHGCENTAGLHLKVGDGRRHGEGSLGKTGVAVINLGTDVSEITRRIVDRPNGHRAC